MARVAKAMVVRKSVGVTPRVGSTPTRPTNEQTLRVSTTRRVLPFLLRSAKLDEIAADTAIRLWRVRL